ncbi:hypothetical protein LDENG_00248490 [Lucifuga dentata]|nr:hypothetical protein LDENG_00248490 [Lucifuga dentata]
MFSAYEASKAAQSMFSRVMRLDLAAWGVKVATIQPVGFKTNLFGNSETIRCHREEILHYISPEVRKDYGDAYISTCCSCLSKMREECYHNICPVLDDMCHALLAAKPKPLYMSGKLGWLLPLICHLCPTSLFDSFLTYITLSRYTDSKPAALAVN